MESTINSITDVIIEHPTDEGEIAAYITEVIETFPNFLEDLQQLPLEIKDIRYFYVAKDKDGNILMVKTKVGYTTICTELNTDIGAYPDCKSEIAEYFGYVKYGFDNIKDSLEDAQSDLEYAIATRAGERGFGWSEAASEENSAKERIKWFKYLLATGEYRQPKEKLYQQ